jgi:ferrous iron transport protein A
MEPGMERSHRMIGLKPGDTALVIGLAKGDRGYRQRLLAMGMTPGVVFSVTRVAPFGDPIEISVRNFTLTLRKAEAEVLEIERV